MRNRDDSAEAVCRRTVQNGQLRLALSGRLHAESIAAVWPDLKQDLGTPRLTAVHVDGSGISFADGAGTALLVYIRQVCGRRNIALEFHGLQEDIASMLSLYASGPLDAAREPVSRDWKNFVEEVGKAFCIAMCGLKEHIAFMGELAVGLGRSLLKPGHIRGRDLMTVVEASGPQALPIIGMLGFLVGLIMAFQGAVLMKQFGAEIYIADFVGISVVRELGPLITAIIVAGRTGSAFAAEIGTMKVNEEIDAFTTMGLDPVRFLVIPRVLGATLMTPLLTIMTNLAGLIGGAAVMISPQLGFPLVTYVNRAIAAVTPTDLLGGLLKALVFGLLISSAGCLCGLRTGEGASAVGHSATRAVVSSITMIVIADGIFAVLFFFLGI